MYVKGTYGARKEGAMRINKGDVLRFWCEMYHEQRAQGESHTRAYLIALDVTELYFGMPLPMASWLRWSIWHVA